MNRLRLRKAFTVVEMVIVIAVIAILSAVLIPTISGVIQKANVSADQQFAASLNIQLALWEVDNGEIKNESDLRDAINEFYGEKDEAGNLITDYYATLAPKSGKNGYHYWYDAANKQVVVNTVKGLLKEDDNEGDDGAAVALASEDAPEFSPASLRSGLVDGYYLMDHLVAPDGKDELTDLITQLETVTEESYNAAKEALAAFAESDYADLAVTLNEKINTTVIINESGMWFFGSGDIYHAYIPVSVNALLGASDPNLDLSRVTEIQIPSGVIVGSGSLNGFKRVADTWDYDGSTTIYVNSTDDIDALASMQGVFQTPDGNRYITTTAANGAPELQRLTENGPVTEREQEYSQTVSEFTIGSSDDYATVVEIQGKVYVPYEKGSVTLYADIPDDVAIKDVTWSIVEDVEGQDSNLIKIDQSGKVTFEKRPEGVYESTVRATAVAGGKTCDITICLVVINDMTVTINDTKVNLTADTPYAEISYDGEDDSFDFVVGEFTTNYLGYTCDTTVTYDYIDDIFTIADGKLTLKKDAEGKITEGSREVTIKVGPSDKPYLEETIKVEVKDASSAPFVPAFEYADKFTYRVGNGNKITLGTLFTCKNAPESFELIIRDEGSKTGTVAPVIGTVEGSSFNATYTANSTDWKQSTIKFSGVGIATIEIDGVELLTLEVVNGTNYFKGDTLSGAPTSHVVLLGDVNITDTLTLNNKCLFGNGFVIDATGASNTAMGIITLNNGAMLDNAIVTGKIYTIYEGNSGNYQQWSTSLVFVNNGIISNSYLSNTKAPVRVGGSTTITNSTISGGCYANIDIRTGELILEDVTLINQVGNTTPSQKALGLGVVVHEDAVSAKVTVKGNLTQYNFVADNQEGYAAEDSALKTWWNSVFKDNAFTDNGVKYVDTGILSLTDEVGEFVDYTEADQAVKNARVLSEFSNGRYFYHIASVNGPQLIQDGYNYENTWKENGYQPSAQGNIPPNYSVVLTKTKPVAGATNYCYLDGSTIKIGFESGGSKTLTFSSDVFNITDSLGNKLDLKSITLDGAAISDTYTFSKAGSYALKVSVEANGKTYTYTLSVNVAITSYKTASISLSSTTATIHGSTSNDYYVVFDILAGVTINDVDENGNTRTQTINNTLPSGWTIALDDTGYIVTVTTNWLNASGEYTTLKITASVSGTGSLTNWTLTCDGNKGCPANALHSRYQATKNSQKTPTATFVYYGFNGQASNSVTLTGSTSLDNQAKHTVTSCVTPDTLVTLADGTQKEIQYVTQEDMLLVWDFYNGEYATVPAAVLINHGLDEYTIITLKFDDGTEVKVVECHEFFNTDANKWVFIDKNNAADYLGAHFIRAEGNSYTSVKLVDYSVHEEVTEAYSIFTAVYYNCFVENMLSITPSMFGSVNYYVPFEIGEDLKYDEEAMQADIEKYGLYTYEDFSDYVTYEQFIGFNAAYFKVSVGKGLVTYEQLIQSIFEYVNVE